MQTTEPASSRGTLNAMTVDVEEHFQVSAFEGVVPRERWETIPSRVERNTARLLELFDECGVRATFFVLGWIAERHPTLVRRIAASGHEVACHGYDHRLVYTQSREVFREQTRRARGVLEDAGGVGVIGYRAASFSIDRSCLWALDELAAAGFEYDSSMFPVRHDRYGVPGAPRGMYRMQTAAGTLHELPPSTVRLGPTTLPVGGGGYLRLYPSSLTHWAIGRLNRRERRPAVVYVHPWEVDPDQPRVGGAPWRSRFRHYVGLRSTETKLRGLLGRFRFGTAAEVIGRAEAVPVHRVA